MSWNASLFAWELSHSLLGVLSLHLFRLRVDPCFHGFYFQVQFNFRFVLSLLRKVWLVFGLLILSYLFGFVSCMSFLGRGDTICQCSFWWWDLRRWIKLKMMRGWWHLYWELVMLTHIQMTKRAVYGRELNQFVLVQSVYHSSFGHGSHHTLGICKCLIIV